MKSLTILSLTAFATFAVGCQKDQPESSFTTEKDVYKEKQSIQFENTSENGISYYWNFGDGESSTLKNPGHTYTETGEYIVTLQVQGAKKTAPSEFSRTLHIVGENSNVSEPDLIFANTTWIADSSTMQYYYCGADVIDNSTNDVNNSMIFNGNNTVLMINGGGTANLCEYELLNDTLIGFYEDPYYRTWSYAVDGDRLTLTNNTIRACEDGSTEGTLFINHFYKE